MLQHAILEGNLDEIAQSLQTRPGLENQVFKLGQNVLPRIAVLILLMQLDGALPVEHDIQTGIKFEQQFGLARQDTGTRQWPVFVLALVRDIDGPRVAKGMDDLGVREPLHQRWDRKEMGGRLFPANRLVAGKVGHGEVEQRAFAAVGRQQLPRKLVAFHNAREVAPKIVLAHLIDVRDDALHPVIGLEVAEPREPVPEPVALDQPQPAGIAEEHGFAAETDIV